MRTVTIFFLSIFFSLSLLNASPERGNNSLDVLRNEVVRLFETNTISFPDIKEQDVTVGFLINARNELIVLDISGDCTAACDYVRQVINYHKIKFIEAKQLTRYTITFHLVKEES
jgi:hypothetical protein